MTEHPPAAGATDDPATVPESVAPTLPGLDVSGQSLGRAATTVSAINAISRVTGFARVVAIAAALGIATLGDAYQSATLVSNVLFELLAGGLLSAVLVPTFVARMSDGSSGDARRLAGLVVGRLAVGLAAVVIVGIAASELLAEALFVGSAPARRPDQVDLATVLLWFVLPQIVLYGIGAVVTAVLQAAHRFAAAAAAPIANNIVVIATMVAFAFGHDEASGLDLTTGEKLLLGGGTLLGTVAMTGVVVVASVRARLSIRPRLRDPGVGRLGGLLRNGLWGAGLVGLSQVHLMAAVIIANSVAGGAIAFTTALAFFLLPFALVAHPLATALAPRLAGQAHRGDNDAFVADIAVGMRVLIVILVPVSALMAALCRPALATIDGLGALDETGLALVGTTLAGLAPGLAGYGAFFLLTRAAYALDDLPSPTVVNLGVTVASIVGMLIVRSTVDGPARLAGLGLVQGAALTVGSIVLALRVQRRTGTWPEVTHALAVACAAALVAGGVAWSVVGAVGWDDRSTAVTASVVGGVLGGATAMAALRLLRAPDIADLWSRGPGAIVRGRRRSQVAP